MLEIIIEHAKPSHIPYHVVNRTKAALAVRQYAPELTEEANPWTPLPAMGAVPFAWGGNPGEDVEVVRVGAPAGKAAPTRFTLEVRARVIRRWVCRSFVGPSALDLVVCAELSCMLIAEYALSRGLQVRLEAGGCMLGVFQFTRSACNIGMPPQFMRFCDCALPVCSWHFVYISVLASVVLLGYTGRAQTSGVVSGPHRGLFSGVASL